MTEEVVIKNRGGTDERKEIQLWVENLGRTYNELVAIGITPSSAPRC